MNEIEENFKRQAEQAGLKESQFSNRYHNGQVAIELDRTNHGQIIVSWDAGSGFERKRFRLTASETDWLARAFAFARRKALELSQPSLGLTNRTVRHRVRRGQV